MGSLRIHERDGIDGVSDTDGIVVTSVALLPSAKGGMIVVQDDKDDKGNQNFKYVRWSAVADALDLE